ncbi:hypothetical protein B296_00051721 [Ensete ventricosum]|uniref:Amino acid transporter transmembrane domain-containing protein n=1 Tax=Ensete ventricosum TaxID=4639 RepID=A0A426WZA5_ENSVE|nr:hypothetical protein B296_00051721 [Ensete ventricosum]
MHLRPVTGHSSTAPPRDYSLPSDSQDLVFGVFNAIAIVATTFGNGIIPEIQATAAPPVTGKMFKGLCLCYTIVVMTFFSVAISGYWAFGNRAQGSITANFILQDGSILVPKWFLMMTNVFVLLQLAAVGVVRAQISNSARNHHHHHHGASEAGMLIHAGILAADQRGARGAVRRPNEGPVLHSERRAEAHLPIAIDRDGDSHSRHAALLRRPQRDHRRFRVPAAGFHGAVGVVQHHLQAVEEKLHLLAERRHRRGVLDAGGAGFHFGGAASGSGRQDIQAFCRCMNPI